MILGVGTDLVDTRRISRLLEAFPERFPVKVLTAAERLALADRPATARQAFLAKTYAAKEACLKALGTGLAKGMCWHDIEVLRLPSGMPQVKLSGKALALAREKAGGAAPDIHVSLGDEGIYALAFVVISAGPGLR